MSRLIMVVLMVIFISGCSGTGFEKRTTIVPGSITIGWGQETYHGDPEAWRGFSASVTWEFK